MTPEWGAVVPAGRGLPKGLPERAVWAAQWELVVTEAVG